MAENTEAKPKSNIPPRGAFGGGRGGGRGRVVEKPKDFKGTFKKFINYLKPYKIPIIVVVIFAIFSTVFSILGPRILGKAITKIFQGVIAKMSGAPNASIDFGYVGRICLILLGLYLVSALFTYIQGYIMSGVAQRVTYNFRKKISEKINKLPLKYFDETTHGEVLSRITNDVDTVSATLNQSLMQIITSVTTIIGIMIMMFSISWLMAIVSIFILPVSAVIVMAIVRTSQRFFKRRQDYLGHVNGHVEEMYAGHNIVQVFNKEEHAIKEFDEYNNELYSASWKSAFLSGIMMPLMNFVGNIGYVVVAILGGYLAIKRAIEVGDIQAFIQYVRSFTHPIAQTANIANILQSTMAAAERVFEFLEEEEEPPEVDNPVTLDKVQGNVEFAHVRFGYTPDKIIIHDFSASIEAEKKVAIVGPTGAGKTTIVKLLMRFYDIQSGEILIDGTNIYNLRRGDLRSLFGMVLQDTWLFNDTIMENIRYGRLSATDEEVIAAAKAAHADHFIRTQPGGYKMVINEEANNISQGQKQLLTIARALLANPEILILDEATSSVDTRTEILIQNALADLHKGRTSFIIAHRLSTIRDADMIFVMNNGDIVEQGNHKELIAKNGFYADLYKSQFELF